MASPFVLDVGHPERGLADLDKAIRAVCPIDGVCVGRWENRDTWRVDFKPEATDAQRAMACDVVNAFKLQDDHSDDMSKPNVIA